jgi:hypothetical protein
LNLSNNVNIYGNLKLGTLINVESDIKYIQQILNYVNNYFNLNNVYISNDLIVGGVNFSNFVSTTNNNIHQTQQSK